MRWFSFAAGTFEQDQRKPSRATAHERPAPRPQPRAAAAEALERREMLSTVVEVSSGPPVIPACDATAFEAVYVRPVIHQRLSANEPYGRTAGAADMTLRPMARAAVPSLAAVHHFELKSGVDTSGLVETKAYLNSPVFADTTGREAARALTTTATHSYAGRPPKPDPKAKLDRVPDGQPVTRPPTVLLIEDDDAGRNALTVLLKRRGFNVVAVATLAEGIQELANDPDRVIVDLVLPDGEGEAILRQVRAAHLHAKVTVMTGIDDDARLDRVRGLGAEAVLHKPISLPSCFTA